MNYLQVLFKNRTEFIGYTIVLGPSNFEILAALEEISPQLSIFPSSYILN